MSRSYQEEESQPFDCSRVGDTVYVNLTYLGMNLGDGQQVRTLSKFHCEDFKECGVATATANGMGWTFDWSKCVHPLMAKQHG